jgi:DNA-binding transcriptional ArsR family regulator
MNDGDLIGVLKALADPTRFKIVQEIAAAGELTCGTLADRFELAQPTISHHLKVLSEAGVLFVRSEGKHHFLSVNHALLGSIGNLLPARLMAKREATRRGKKTEV